MLHKVNFYIVDELTKSLLTDPFSIEEIDESFLLALCIQPVPLLWKRLVHTVLSSEFWRRRTFF